MQDVLEKDKSNREELQKLYTQSLEYISQLPSGRKKELEQNIPEFCTKLEQNRESVKKSECAILVAGSFHPILSLTRRPIPDKIPRITTQ